MPARFLSVVSAALVLVAALPARAEDVPLPFLAPVYGYRYITEDKATTTSECIGDPKTPLCAVETYLACWRRYDAKLCRIAAPLDDYEPFLHAPPPSPSGEHEVFMYRVERQELLTEKTLPWRPSPKGHFAADVINLAAGDVRVDVVHGSCTSKKDSYNCAPYNMSDPVAYIVRRQGDRWILIDEVYADNPPEPPGNFLSVTGDNATSSSKCIGRPGTPICAVETYVACRLRADPDLCRIARVKISEPVYGSMAYRVVREQALTDESQDLPYLFNRDDMAAGDVRIDLIEQPFSEKEPPSDCCHYWSKIAEAYILRRRDDRWVVIFKGPEVDPRTRHW